MKNKRKSYAFAVLLVSLLLPSLCMFPGRSKYIAYTEERRENVRANKVLWEKRFNDGAGVVFVTAMLWILFVAPMVLIRENDAKVSDETDEHRIK
jgi:hypothetical protein